jgi:hypothetical protein
LTGVRPAVGAAAAVVTAILLVSGCASAPPPTPYATATAADLQQAVLHVTEAAGDGDHAAALTRLSELEVAAKVAHARGEISEARQDSILSAIALVRADLEALIAEAQRKAEEEAERKAEEARRAAEAKAAEEEAKRAAEAEREAAQRAAEQQAAERQAADDDDDDDGNGKNKGKGKNNGKGKGKDD